MPFTYKVQKGDTLNTISNRYGFRNYRDSGIDPKQLRSYKNKVPLKQGQSYADIIGIGEEITLANYDPNKVQTSGTGATTLVSSKDNALKNEKNGNIANEKLGLNQDPNAKEEITSDPNVIEDKGQGKQKEPLKEIDGITDPNYVKSRLDDQAKREEASLKMEDRKAEYMLKIDSRLARNDARYAERVNRINSTWDKRIKVQNRLNKLKDDRIKAYGAGGSAIYKPLQFTGAVNQNEQDSADKIAELDGMRDQLLNEAKNAFDTGESLVLDDKIKEIDRLEQNMEQKYIEIERESEKQYKLFEKLEKETEAEDKLLREKTLKEFVAYVSLNFTDGMTPEEKTAEIERIMMEKNLTLSEANNAIMEGLSIASKGDKASADLAYKKAQTKLQEEKVRTEKSKQAKNYRTKDGAEVDEDLFSGTQLKELNRAGLKDAPQQQKIDYIDLDPEAYKIKYPNGAPTESDTINEKQKNLRNKYNY